VEGARVDRELQHRASQEPSRERHPAAAIPAQRVLALQRGAGNRAVAGLLRRPARPVIARSLDTEFEHGGTASEEEQSICDDFGAIVSGFVDQAHLDLLGGRVKEWKGAKITAFLKLLTAGKRTALVHAGSVIEERVYALMKSAKLPAPWKAQFAQDMGSVSRPDIVIHLGEGRYGLIDITSQRGHILGKAGGWTTSVKYVYVAEAWFPSVFAEHLPHIRKAIAEGGIGEKELAAMQADVAESRKSRVEARKKELAEALALYNEHDSFAAFVRDAFDGDRGGAIAWMREHGLGTRKGVPRRKGKRKRSERTKKAARRAAVKRNAELTPAVVHERSKQRALDYRKKKKESAMADKRATALVVSDGEEHEDEEAEVEMGEGGVVEELELAGEEGSMEAEEGEFDEEGEEEGGEEEGELAGAGEAMSS
jgi:hypothetical protein